MRGRHGHELAAAVREHTQAQLLTAGRLVRGGRLNADGSISLIDGGSLTEEQYEVTEGYKRAYGSDDPDPGDLVLLAQVGGEYYAFDLVR